VHELGICQGIVSASIEAAEKQGAVRIKEIRVDVGELSEVVEYALQFAFESITPGTMAEGSVLVVNNLPARSRCTLCGTEFEHGRFDALCPECDNPFNESIGGRELDIASIDVVMPGDEDADDPPSAPSQEAEDVGESPPAPDAND
jgi:hydrogenase nickel incorporation protein HypA/HybF